MQVVCGIHEMGSVAPVGALTLGNFDGVHLGHQKLIRELVRVAHSLGSKASLMTFSPHPLQVLRPDLRFSRLFDHKDQERMFAQGGVDLVVLQDFNLELAELSANEFFEEYIWRPFRPRSMVVGYDFCFGRQRKGTVDLLGQLLHSRGSELIIVGAEYVDGAVVSSSRIRQELLRSEVRKAGELLGRNYTLEGQVVRGEGRGNSIGVPTANIESTLHELPLGNGVYACWVHVDRRRLPGVTNVGVNPTFVRGVGRKARKVESHILGFNEDLYGKIIRIEFVDFLRSEIEFPEKGLLVQQIHEDIINAKRILNVPLG
jgi:riboflavin kinase/FMN adenylyltransferase